MLLYTSDDTATQSHCSEVSAAPTTSTRSGRNPGAPGLSAKDVLGLVGWVGCGAGVLGCPGCKWGRAVIAGGCLLSFASLVTPTFPRAAALAGGTLVLVVAGTYAWWQCCVFRCWIGHEPCAHFAGQHTNPWGSPLTVICDSKFPLLVHARLCRGPGVACLSSNPRQSPWGCCVSCVSAK
jgi:hypothetical protein